MNNPVKRIETFANISILVLAVLIGFVFVKKYLLVDPAQPTSEIFAGTKISLPDINWAKNDQTLLVVLQKGCRFCSESAQFYQRLVREADESRNVRLVAVLPQNTDIGKEYLNDLGVSINEVKQTSLQSLGVRGTPTLILVNNKGEVIDSWVGKLPTSTETEVLNRLQVK